MKLDKFESGVEPAGTTKSEVLNSKGGDRKMDMLQLASNAKVRLEEVTGLKVSSVTGIAQEEEHWVVTLEMLEKKSIPDSMDILGIYEVKMDTQGSVFDFARTRLRKRGDTTEA